PPAPQAPALAVAPLSRAGALRHQQHWAKHLRQPVLATNTVGMSLALIPPGEFSMGMTPEDLARLEAKGGDKATKQQFQAHKVRLDQPYYLGVHEVTVGQFRQFVRATK